jgi:hypothetical protein
MNNLSIKGTEQTKVFLIIETGGEKGKLPAHAKKFVHTLAH